MINSMFNLVSYAQNFEDIILWRALSKVPDGRYIDVGAQSPDEHSVSRLFYAKGWRGVHVEPTQHYSDMIRNARPDEQVIQAAVTDVPGELRFFDIAETGLSTLDAAIAEQHRQSGFDVVEVRVPAITLDDVFESAGPGDVHWLKIDVEGAEHEVIAGWKSPRRPWMLAIESTRPLSPEPSHQTWEPLVLDKGYVFAYFDGLNRFYVSAEHLELLPALTCGPNVFDDFVLAPGSSFCGAANAVAAEQQARSHEALTRADQELRKAHADADALREAGASLRHDVEMLSEAVEAYKEDFERAQGVGHNAVAEIGRRDQELAQQNALIQELLNSKSWRVTAPLRWAMGSVVPLVRQPRTLARETVVGLMRAALARPRLGRVLNRGIRLVPRLHERLRLLATHRGFVPPAPEVALVCAMGQVQIFDEGSSETLLSLRARGLNQQLRHPKNSEES